MEDDKMIADQSGVEAIRARITALLGFDYRSGERVVSDEPIPATVADIRRRVRKVAGRHRKAA